MILIAVFHHSTFSHPKILTREFFLAKNFIPQIFNSRFFYPVNVSHSKFFLSQIYHSTNFSCQEFLASQHFLIVDIYAFGVFLKRNSNPQFFNHNFISLQIFRFKNLSTVFSSSPIFHPANDTHGSFSPLNFLSSKSFTP